jgi:hypothetical protein
MDAIITAATGYTEIDLQPFLCSVQRNCRNAKVFLIVYEGDRAHTEKLKRKYCFVEPIYIKKNGTISGNTTRKRLLRTYLRLYHYWTAYLLSTKNFSSITPKLELLGRSLLHIAIERYFIALRIVRELGDSFEKVLLTDSRDVVIQKDPFSLISEKTLISGLEEVTVRNESLNSKWIRQIYGKSTLDKMLDWQVVCSGVTLGTVEEVEKYLSVMCHKVWERLPKSTFQTFDQGFHNHLCFEKDIPIQLTNNRQGLIATLSFEKSMFNDLTNRLVQVHGECPAIVHQYDRYPEMQDFLKGIYASSEK